MILPINNHFSSPNYSEYTKSAKRPVKYIITHFTEVSFIEALKLLTSPIAQVSAHYLIKEDGEILQLVDENHIAWHAGESYWQGHSGLNEHSIGIELVNSGKEAFKPPQLAACLRLAKAIKERHDIATPNFIGHADIAPQRKIDPGIYFNWEFFANYGLGRWFQSTFIEPQLDPSIISKPQDQGEVVAQLQQKLANIGYYVPITGIHDQQLSAVIRSFQAKYCPQIIKHHQIDYYDLNADYPWDSYSNAILRQFDDLDKKLPGR